MFITKGKIVEEIKIDSEFKAKIEELVKIKGKNKTSFIVEGSEAGMRFNNSDLYFSIHRADMRVEGKRSKGKWNLLIKLHDTYDYTQAKELQEYINDTNGVAKSMFSSTLYNMAYFSMRVGVIKKYEIYIKFEMSIDAIK